MIRVLLYAFLALFTAATLSGCGTKGKLKTPSQVEQQEQKKAKKEAEEKAKAQKEKQENVQPPATTETK